MKQKITLKDKKPGKQINGKFNNIDSANKNKYKKNTLQQFLPLRS
jgi:hypothetical protein